MSCNSSKMERSEYIKDPFKVLKQIDTTDKDESVYNEEIDRLNINEDEEDIEFLKEIIDSFENFYFKEGMEKHLK